ncbi:sensor histidine kinase [Dyella flagellata]|uniref:histidine kinase n=1 Tax=Dyella flagellata TaxID=1867833 RepID=A0ABQ5XGF0_9GAMM|nr:ATP-binding protein [Dyella flagellata]GLQ90417.1 histidine kinase/response regulator hybrid protein [Dyella flagellata]
MRLRSLEARFTLWLAVAALTGALVCIGVTHWPLPEILAWLHHELGLEVATPNRSEAAVICAAILAPLSWCFAHIVMNPVKRLLRALESAVASYRDGDFSISIALNRRDELGDLVRVHNELGRTLREQRQNLTQRELLLDTVVQNTPVALVLTDTSGRVAYANIAARHLFHEGRSLNGLHFATLIADMPEALRKATEGAEDALFSVEMDGSEETFHLSQRAFRLQGRPHRLQLFRRMTRELSRQEVAAWKRVIRVVSHELNNSLAPISSMAHSGAELARRGDLERLPGVFATIGERARHLHGFIDGYARFAKLPAPRPVTVEWPPFLDALTLHCQFQLQGQAPPQPGWFDPVQIEQVLINLVKNAHESGSPPEGVTLGLSLIGHELRIEVADRGPGMSEAVLAQALLPFYSTKRSGTGLGLALAREISEAHGGRIALANREDGGLRVTLLLPQPGPSTS